jgi:hypothetical protein
MARSKMKRELNLLDLVPKRIVEYEVADDGIVTLFAPRFKSAFLKKWLQPKLKRPYLRVTLDEIGSAVWLLCDGGRNVKEIAAVVQERFEERIEPCYERMGLFFQQLDGARFIAYTNLDQCYVERPGGDA